MDIEDGVEDLARIIEYLENQSRRNNVKIFGIPEDDDEKSWDDTESKVKEAIRNKLGIEDEIKIERATGLESDLLMMVNNGIAGMAHAQMGLDL